MKAFMNYVFLLTLVLLSFESYSQMQQLKFSKMSGTNGISLGKINNMAIDKYGFMWFSDQSNRCIIRYDGAQMKRYKNDPQNPNSLGGYYPECLFTDSTGIIWIGFYGQGLDRFDPTTNTFTHYRHNENDDTSLSHDFVSAIFKDHLGNIWVGNDGGLDLLNEETGTFEHFRNISGDSTSISSNLVRVIYEDREGTLWIGTGMPWAGNDDGGLNRFNRNTKTFTRYLHDPNDTNSLTNNKVRAILEDSRGTFWIGTAGEDGLHTMDRSTGEFTRYVSEVNFPDKLSRTPVASTADHITFLEEDVAGQIWIGTFQNGVSRYDPLNQKIIHYGIDRSSSDFEDNSGWWAQANDDGIIWLTTQQANLYKIDLYNDNIPHTGSSPNDETTSFCDDNDDIFWIGTPYGLIRKNLKNETSTTFIHDPDNPNSLSSSEIHAIIKDRHDGLWIGTNNGISLYDPDTEKFTNYLVSSKLENEDQKNNVQALLEDEDSNIWIGTGGNGLFKLDKNSGKIINYKTIPTDLNSLSSNDITALEADKGSNIWVGTGENSGICLLNYATGEIKRYLSGLIIGSIYRDSDSIIWVGIPEGGLYRYDRLADEFKSIGEDNSGLEVPNVFGITSDQDNNLWIATASGICKLNNKRDQTTWFGIENGILPETHFEIGGAFTSKDWKIYFADVRGYYSFFPSINNLYNKKTSLYFTNFKLNDRELLPDNEGPLKTALIESDELILDYNQNVFSIEFTAVNYRQNESNNIQFRLENYDDDWRLAGFDKKAHYYKVPFGQYVFRIKTPESGSGIWVEKNIAITILPPWWRTWWAYILYGLLFVSGVIAVHLYQKSRLLKAEREKAREREMAHAREIEKAYQELGIAHDNLKSTQTQLIQSEKMASLGELTAGIAHEIQNPLNFVNNFSEVSNEMIDEVNEELDKGDIEEVKYILSDIKGNLEKINHHGKRADAIVKGMLQHSRASTGHKEKTDINALCDEYLRLAYHACLAGRQARLPARQGLRAKEKDFNAELMTDLDPNLPKIEIIPQDIGRVLLNLINNAFYAVNDKSQKTSEEYEPTVSVSTKNLNDSIEISVKDNGSGIPDSIKDKIFQPFFTTKPTGQGTGLGLSLSYDIVKAHGGALKVETKEGEGTEFIIQLPVV